MKVYVIRVETDEEYYDVEMALETEGFYYNDLLEVYEDEEE